MSHIYDNAIQTLINELNQLPGIGAKSSQRIAFYLLQSPTSYTRSLTHAIEMVKSKVKFCSICGNIGEEKLCSICRDPKRDDSIICVVEEPKDVVAIEKTQEFQGKYHVLNGAISPMHGINVDQLRIKELLRRLSDNRINEIIIATNPNLEGEATATYISRVLHEFNITITRIASGLPVGGDLEYADEITLSRAFIGRRKI